MSEIQSDETPFFGGLLNPHQAKYDPETDRVRYLLREPEGEPQDPKVLPNGAMLFSDELGIFAIDAPRSVTNWTTEELTANNGMREGIST